MYAGVEVDVIIGAEYGTPGIEILIVAFRAIYRSIDVWYH